MQSEMDFADLARDVVTWALVVVGWAVVNDQNQSREIAKSGYDRIQAVRSAIKLVEQDALKFHTSQFDRRDMYSLMSSINQISRELSQLRKHGFIGQGVSERAQEIRKSITSQNFDPGKHALQDRDSEILREIEAACATIDRELVDHGHQLQARSRTLWQSFGAVFGRRR